MTSARERIIAALNHPMRVHVPGVGTVTGMLADMAHLADVLVPLFDAAPTDDDGQASDHSPMTDAEKDALRAAIASGPLGNYRANEDDSDVWVQDDDGEAIIGGFTFWRDAQIVETACNAVAARFAAPTSSGDNEPHTCLHGNPIESHCDECGLPNNGDKGVLAKKLADRTGTPATPECKHDSYSNLHVKPPAQWSCDWCGLSWIDKPGDLATGTPATEESDG